MRIVQYKVDVIKIDSGVCRGYCSIFGGGNIVAWVPAQKRRVLLQEVGLVGLFLNQGGPG